jgi:tetratricopeptide (TPR) repeat protein
VRFFAGDYPAAAEIHARALETFRAIGERGNEAVSLNHYAAALAATGQRERAFELYQQALAINRELDKPDDEAISLEGIAEYHLAKGDTADAALGTAHLRQALSIYRNLGMRADVDRVSARLDGLG